MSDWNTFYNTYTPLRKIEMKKNRFRRDPKLSLYTGRMDGQRETVSFSQEQRSFRRFRLFIRTYLAPKIYRIRQFS